MKKLLVVFFIFLLTIFLIPLNYITFADDYYILGGMPAGFTMCERGAKVVSICDILTENGLCSPAKDCEILENDIILSIDGRNINCGKELSNEIKDKNQCNITIMRDNEVLTKKIQVFKDINGLYKIGVVIKECPSGIGTITYFHNGTFASLGHPVLDEDNNIMNILVGKVYDAQITSCTQGKRGKAGELRGIIFKDKLIGEITKNTTTGVYGKAENYNTNNGIKIEIGVAEMGDAEIYSTVFGSSPQKYKISIIKTDGLFTNEKNLVIKITDEKLLNITNGIVQGMSGSPIIQNGKLVGAVTHVFINDSTRGYGIKIQDMINN